MAEKKRSIFNDRATESLNSPDDLDKYVQVTNPSVWLLLFACAFLIVGLISWGFFGFVEEHEKVLGCVVGGRAVCFVNASKSTDIQQGDDAQVDTKHHFTVRSVSLKPLSKDEVTAMTGSEFLSDTLVTDRWAYLVEFDGDVTGLIEEVPITFDVTTDRVAPISFVLGGGTVTVGDGSEQ